MNWTYLSKDIYFQDGSLRDIYILDVNINDWKFWVDLINKNYIVEFFDRKSKISLSKIDFDKVIEYWAKVNEEGVYAAFYINEIKVMCYFNYENEIENDFPPSSIKNINDHNNLMEYLLTVNEILKRPVCLTREMQQDDILININQGEIFFGMI